MNRKILNIIVILLLFVSGSFFTSRQVQAQFPWMENPLVGQSAPDFTLQTFDGKKVNMTEFRDDKSAIIFFWATWCPHCRESLKELNQNYSVIEGKGIKLILVDIGEQEREVRSYIERNKISPTILLDKEGALTESYAIIGVPTFVFVDTKGVIKAVEHSLPDNYEKLLSTEKAVKN